MTDTCPARDPDSLQTQFDKLLANRDEALRREAQYKSELWDARSFIDALRREVEAIYAHRTDIDAVDGSSQGASTSEDRATGPDTFHHGVEFAVNRMRFALMMTEGT